MHFSDWSRIPSRRLAAVAAVLAVTAGIAVLAGSSLATGKTVARPVARAAQASCSSGTTVQTSSGPVCGISYPAGTSATGIVAQTSFNQWLGIPYAAPPVGQLRWQPPQPYQASPTTTLAAVTQPPGCPGSGTSTASEDCLQLDITAPTGVGSALPVIFYIHGGGFTGGTTSTYPEQELATSGPAIVVGVEYRLGVLGFLADKALGAHSGDFGLQDQQFAMNWVKQNISAFGGDPSQHHHHGQLGRRLERVRPDRLTDRPRAVRESDQLQRRVQLAVRRTYLASTSGLQSATTHPAASERHRRPLRSQRRL